MTTLTRLLAVTATTVVVAVSMTGCSGGQPEIDEVEPPTIDNRPVGVEDPAEVPDTGDDDTDCQLGSYSPSDKKSADEIKKIIERDRLIVGVDQTTYLMGYRDPETGRMDGFDIQIARQIAKDLLGDSDKVQFRAMSSADREDALIADQVDIVVRTMTITCPRWENIAFSGEYYRAGQKVLVPDTASDDVNDLAGKKVCAAKGSTSLARIESELRAKPVAARDWTDCMILLQQGHIAGMSTDDVILAGMAAQDPKTKVIGEAISAEPYGIGVKQENVGLTRFVNSTLERILEDGTWEDIYADTLQGPLGKGEPPNPEYGREE